MHKIVAFCFLGLVVPVSAIVVQNYPTAEAAPSGPGLDLDWDYVYNYKGSSAVAVGGGWILTAGHVADDGGNGSLTIDGMVYTQQAIVPHPSADLALVRYDKALPGYYDLYTGSIPAGLADPKLPVLMVGYGTTGTVSSTSWADSGSGRGIKRWGSQQIDKTDSGDDKFWMYFSSSSTANEAGAGTGDSGGGVFYKDGDTWKLAGISVSIGANAQGFNRTDAMSMPYYADWVMDTIPEPAAMGLMGFGTIGLFLARTKRRRKLGGRSLFPIRGDDPACDLVIAKVEDVAHERKRAQKKEIQMWLLPAWGKVHGGYKGLDKMFWTHMVAAHERRAVRKKAIKRALKKKAINRFDAFLERIMK